MATRDEGAKSVDKISILMDMRPALEVATSGIPQEVRLLSRGLHSLGRYRVEGLIQNFSNRLSAGLREKQFLAKEMSPAARYNRLSKFVISATNRNNPVRKALDRWLLALRVMLGLGRIKLGRFDPGAFLDFTWKTLYAKTLPPGDLALMASFPLRICSLPLKAFQTAGFWTYRYLAIPRFPKIDTGGYDLFIAQTPYPGLVARGTRLVVRYHDAIPILMPHTIQDRSNHQASHYQALLSNVHAGAYFVCDSEAVRQDLLRIFPELEARSRTIHALLSHNYFNEESPASDVLRIIKARLWPKPSLRPKLPLDALHEGSCSNYLLMVSSIEPRKNHLRLIAAWEQIRARLNPNLKLIIVGGMGWEHAEILEAARPWIEEGSLFMLTQVPAADLRLLYKHAQATVCPSYSEGFDYSGVESMACGGVTIASDIAVHREVYDDAALYFDPYSTESLVATLKELLHGTGAEEIRARLRQHGAAVSARYRPDAILPQWQALIDTVATTA